MPTTVLLAGLPGKMAEAVARLLLAGTQPGLVLFPIALAGRSSRPSMEIDGHEIALFGPDRRDQLELPDSTIAIDFTTPTAALDNIAWYKRRRLPFVMGTTGYDRDAARQAVLSGTLPAVMAPNMAIPIVLLQAAMGEIARRFPGALEGYDFSLTESHQQGKKDTSGTAKALVRDLAALGLPASEEGIVKYRDPQAQRRDLGVPEEHLAGHAYHFYGITSPDGTARVAFSHCVHGRGLYAEGALVAARFLAARLAEGVGARVYSMEDVLGGVS